MDGRIDDRWMEEWMDESIDVSIAEGRVTLVVEVRVMWRRVKLCWWSPFLQVGDSCLHIAARYNNQSVMKVLLHSACSLTDTNQVVRHPLATLYPYTQHQVASSAGPL